MSSPRPLVINLQEYNTERKWILQQPFMNFPKHYCFIYLTIYD